MKPSFALNFTDDAIGLLHRTTRGWMEVGVVPMDEPDLPQAVTYLRGSALGLEPGGLTTKLVIPNSQIRYMTLPAPGPDAAARRRQIKAALEGRTPYAVDELVFDWWGKGATVQVAVVARETLEEAEAFAKEHRLNPLCFVAIPEPGEFGGEPWFGLSQMAPSLLTSGEKVDRDQDPIQIVARTGTRPEPDLSASAAPKAAIDPVPDVPAALPDAAPAAADMVRDDPIAPAPSAGVLASDIADPEAISSKMAEVKPEGAAATEAVAPPIAQMPAAPDSPPVAAAAPVAFGAKDAVRPSDGPTDTQAVPMVKKSPPTAPRPPVKVPPRPQDMPAAKRQVMNGGPGGARLSTVPSPPRATKIAEAEWPLERVAISARGQGKAETARSAAMITAPSIPMPRDRKLTIVPSPAPDPTPAVERPTRRGRAEAEAMTVFGARQARQRGKPRYLGLILTAALLLLLALVAAWSSLYVASRDVPDATGQAATPVGATPGAGALPDAEADAQATAADAAAGSLPDEPLPVQTHAADMAAVPDEAAADTTTLGLAPTTEDELLADLQDPADFAAPTDEQAIALPVPEATVTAIVPPDAVADPAASGPDAQNEPAEAAPAPLPAATVAQPDLAASDGAARSPKDEPQDEIFLAAVDPTPLTSDAVAIAAPVAAEDTLPASQLAPPPFGTVYRFDAQGRIIPTPEGIITPEGVRLVAGKPPLVPPPRPAAPAPAVDAASGSVAGLVSAASAADLPLVGADPALAAARPRLRPRDLAPAAVEKDDGAALDLAANVRFSSLRPRARPPEILAAGAAALAETTAAVQAASASLVASLDAGPASGSALAVAVSRKPAPRPAIVNRSIEAAVSLAAADASLASNSPILDAPALIPDAPVAAVPQSDDPAVVERDEPEVASVAPSIPTRASVAKQATTRNAINLAKTNLIGVYGTSANRYAMVRQSNGRFVKVGVGDRIEGGRVAAISEKELHYVKNGRTVTLAMPKG